MSAEAISRALERASRHVEDTTKKILHRMYLDETRQSMYAELKESIISNSVWARSYGIDPLASKFSPESVHDLPVELSQWLHLFYAYLQVEQAYADALASLGRTEPRLIDPPAHKTLQEEMQECWNLMMYANEKGQASISHKKLW